MPSKPCQRCQRCNVSAYHYFYRDIQEQNRQYDAAVVALSRAAARTASSSRSSAQQQRNGTAVISANSSATNWGKRNPSSFGIAVNMNITGTANIIEVFSVADQIEYCTIESTINKYHPHISIDRAAEVIQRCNMYRKTKHDQRHHKRPERSAVLQKAAHASRSLLAVTSMKMTFKMSPYYSRYRRITIDKSSRTASAVSKERLFK